MESIAFARDLSIDVLHVLNMRRLMPSRSFEMSEL